MGFGKWVLGGVCAVGAVIAAPVVLPAAGMAVIGSSLGATGAGVAAGLGMMAASSGTVATTAAVAGMAGVAAGAAQEKRIDNAYSDGKRDGQTGASKEYEEKMRNQADEFLNQKKNLENDIEEYDNLLKKYKEYIENLKNAQEGDSENLELMVKKYNALYALQQLS